MGRTPRDVQIFIMVSFGVLLLLVAWLSYTYRDRDEPFSGIAMFVRYLIYPHFWLACLVLMFVLTMAHRLVRFVLSWFW